ncbi:MAG: hypothetical protein R3C05_14130 [Pirellulaceae bacterium]
MSPHHRQFLFAAISLSLGFCGGCASFTLSPSLHDDEQQDVRLTESPEAAMFRALQTARTSNAVVLQIEGAEKPLRVLPLPEDGTSVFMNDLIRQLNLNSKFGALDVTLFRSSGEVMDGVKMSVTFDRKTGRVNAGTDYALRPGDRITIRKVYTSTIQNFIEGLVPPIARR